VAVVDTHLHLWDADTYYRLHGDWLDAYPDLKRSFLPAELKANFDEAGVACGIVIEAGRDSHRLNLWLLETAAQEAHLAGVVAGLWLHNARKFEWLDQYCDSPHFLGIRTHPPGEPAQWIEQPALGQLLDYLGQRDRVFEMLITHEMGAAVAALADRHPNLAFVIDHCGLPPTHDGEFNLWRQAMRALAHRPNMFMKFSTHQMAPLTGDFLQRFAPVSDVLMDTFGVDRLMWGSNYPVETRGGTYAQVVDQFRKVTDALSPTEKEALFELTAKHTYRLKP
jgi:L-fuconolactonase